MTITALVILMVDNNYHNDNNCNLKDNIIMIIMTILFIVRIIFMTMIIMIILVMVMIILTITSIISINKNNTCISGADGSLSSSLSHMYRN